jgi:hypothetical protein
MYSSKHFLCAFCYPSRFGDLIQLFSLKVWYNCFDYTSICCLHYAPSFYDSEKRHCPFLCALRPLQNMCFRPYKVAYTLFELDGKYFYFSLKHFCLRPFNVALAKPLLFFTYESCYAKKKAFTMYFLATLHMLCASLRVKKKKSSCLEVIM